ncbi:MAG: HAMP domain-containing histidine kinase [Nitrospirae bacterium]|nr:HAMP domain-containing histidine kinase [Nitrospirota bacterium]
MSLSSAFNAVRHVIMLAVMVIIWLLLGMVYLDRFFVPFDRLIPWLMPWKGLATIPLQASLSERLSIMQGLLDSSGNVANYSLFVMFLSFAVFSAYLSLVYQQKQRKTHENRLLRLKNQEIARRNEFIRYISATIGHEFKNNLGRIKRRLDLLADLPQDTAERIDENFDKLFADIEIFKKISDEREAVLIDFRRVDLREMLLELSRQHSDLIDIAFPGKGGEGAQSVIFASQTLLRTVFENLIDNAIKYRKPDQPRARMFLSCSMDIDSTRRYVSLSFRDEGIGMDERQADRCFYKGKRTKEGWGEGLYFAKYVVGLHAGKIRVGKEYTRPGVGTEIIINLPFIEEALYV